MKPFLNYLSNLPPKIFKWFSPGKKKAIYGLLFFLLVVLFAGIFRYSESPSFCGLCHNMKEYVESWKMSSHNKVTCLNCHRGPGLANHIQGKWVDLQLTLTYILIGK